MKGTKEQVCMHCTKNYKKGDFTTTLISDGSENEIINKNKESDVYFTKLIKEEITPYEINEENPKWYTKHWKGIEKSLQLHYSRKSDKYK
jgi:hypothetical protein